MKQALAILAAVLVPAGAGAQEWTQFRGPNGTGISPAKGIPVQWTDKDLRWRVPIPGEGHAQPVVWGDKIFLTSARDQGRERLMICLSTADGTELWSKSIPLSSFKKHDNNSYASGSPVVDAERVIACFADTSKYLVKAWDHGGKELWTADLGPFVSQHGQGSSPILFDQKVIVTNDQDGASFIVALDARSGKPVWKCERKSAKEGTAYGTPCVVQRGGKAELLTTSRAHGISALDPKTGTLLWEANVFDKRAVSSPVVAGDLVIGTCGQGKGGTCLAAVKLGGRGDVTSTHVAYSIKAATPYVPTPLVVGDRIFMLNDIGVASCLEAATGRVVWSERLGGDYYASPVLIEGRVYCASRGGECVVFEASDQFKIVSKNPLLEGSHATPCVSGSRLYFRTYTHLVCVGGK